MSLVDPQKSEEWILWLRMSGHAIVPLRGHAGRMVSPGKAM
jgi:hypothetical protein